MRYTQYTHKISVPMRQELYDYLAQFPHGIKAQIARTSLSKAKTHLENVEPKDMRAHLYDLVNGRYNLLTESGYNETGANKD